ncbi:MAG: type II secretion system protein GspG [Pirellulales bacterium]
MKKRVRANRRRRAGFTLIEILLVLVIVSVVAGAAMLSIFAQQDRAYINLTKQQISQAGTALKTYRLNSGSYPNTLNALWENPGDLPAGQTWTQSLDKPMAADPWGSPFEYKLNGNSYEIRSAGPDKQMNTEDDITG